MRRMMLRRAGGDNPFQNAVANYAFEETAGNLLDSVNNYDGIVNDATVTREVVGKVNNGYEFAGIDGVNSVINLPTTIYNDFDINNYTVGFWFKTNNVTKAQFLISDFNFGSYKLLQSINNQKINFQFNDNGETIILSSLSTINNNQWYFVMLKSDNSGKAKLYVDDVLQNEHTFVNAPISTTNEITIGKRNFSSNFVFWGKMDELFFINGQTTRETDALIYNNGNGITI